MVSFQVCCTTLSELLHLPSLQFSHLSLTQVICKPLLPKILGFSGFFVSRLTSCTPSQRHHHTCTPSHHISSAVAYPSCGEVDRATGGSQEVLWGTFTRVKMLRLLFTRGTRKTCSSPTLRRGGRAGSGRLCLPPSDSFQGGLAGPRLGPREARATGVGPAEEGMGRPPGSSGYSRGIDTALKDEKFCPWQGIGGQRLQ